MDIFISVFVLRKVGLVDGILKGFRVLYLIYLICGCDVFDIAKKVDFPLISLICVLIGFLTHEVIRFSYHRVETFVSVSGYLAAIFIDEGPFLINENIHIKVTIGFFGFESFIMA